MCLSYVFFSSLCSYYIPNQPMFHGAYLVSLCSYSDDRLKVICQKFVTQICHSLSKTNFAISRSRLGAKVKINLKTGIVFIELENKMFHGSGIGYSPLCPAIRDLRLRSIRAIRFSAQAYFI